MSRYDVTEFEWRVIEPLLPNKPRGVPRVEDRRVLNGIFLGTTIRCALARPSRELWPTNHLLQSLRAMAKGGYLGSTVESYQCRTTVLLR